MAAAIENVKWEVVVREEINHECALSPSTSHPLQPRTVVIAAQQLDRRVDEPAQNLPLDPLSALAAKQDMQPTVDPLSSAKSEKDGTITPSVSDSKEEEEAPDEICDEEGLWYGGEKFVSWAVRKTQIVQTFTTTGTIQMPSFVSSEVRFDIQPCIFSSQLQITITTSRSPRPAAAGTRYGHVWHPSRTRATTK
jgi:hypothetical protein